MADSHTRAVRACWCVRLVTAAAMGWVAASALTVAAAVVTRSSAQAPSLPRGGLPFVYRFVVGGDGPTPDAPRPHVLVAAADGGFYGARSESGRDHVLRFAADGTLQAAWPSPASDLAVGPDGSIWAAEPARTRVAHYSAWGAYLGSIGTAGEFGRAADGAPCPARLVTVGPDGSVHVLGPCRGLQRFAPGGGAAQAGAEVGDAGAVRDLVAGGDGRLYTTTPLRISVFDRDGSLIDQWDRGEGTGPGQFACRDISGYRSPPEMECGPFGLALAPDGAIVASDHGRLRRFSPGGAWLGDVPFQDRVFAILSNGIIVFASPTVVPIQAMAPDGSPLGEWFRPALGEALLAAPVALAEAPDGPVMVADRAQRHLQWLGPHGELGATIGLSEPEHFWVRLGDGGDMVVAGDGGFWLTNPAAHEVVRYARAGRRMASVGGPVPVGERLQDVAAVAVAGDGEVVVADSGNGRIVRFGPDGSVRGAFPVTWPGASEPLGAPVADVAADADGAIVVVDRANHRIRRFTRDGTPLEVWGDTYDIPRGLLWPTGVAVLPGHGYFVADDGHQRVVVLAPTGAYVRSWEVGPGALVAVAAAGERVYVLTRGVLEPDSRVHVYDATGGPLGVWEVTGHGSDLAVDAAGDVLVLALEPGWRDVLRRFGPGGDLRGEVQAPTQSGHVAPAPDGGLVFGGEGAVLAADALGTITATWRVTFVEGGYLDGPKGVALGRALDGTPVLYVSNTGLGRIEVFGLDGRHLRTIGAEGTAPGQFRGPVGLAVGEDGALWVADAWNARVQKIAADGRVAQVFTGFTRPRRLALGRDGTVYVLDGDVVQARGPAGESLGVLDSTSFPGGDLVAPTDIAIAADGTLWVADPGAHRVVAFGSTPMPAWHVSVYPDAALVGGPAQVSVADRIDADWGLEAPLPGLPADGFAVRFERVVPLSGDYRWMVSGEGRVAFAPGDDQPAIEVEGHPFESTVSATLGTGLVRIRVDFVDTGGRASVRLAPLASPPWPAHAWLPLASRTAISRRTGSSLEIRP